MLRLKTAVYLLPVLALLLSANPSYAQRGFGIGIGVGRGYPGYYGYGYGYPGYLPAYPGYYYPRSGMGIYTPGYYTYYPNYVQPSAYYYVSPSLSPRAAAYYSGGYTGSAYAGPGYGGAPPQSDSVSLSDSDALFNVKVPPNAEVWINGDKTTQTGSQREFISNGLTPGKLYTYEVRAKWTQDGKTFDKTQKVQIQGGERRTADFRLPDEG